jgi:hypothetical protein
MQPARFDLTEVREQRREHLEARGVTDPVKKIRRREYDADLAKRDVTGDLPDLRLAFLDFDPIRRGGREQRGATGGGDASA